MSFKTLFLSLAFLLCAGAASASTVTSYPNIAYVQTHDMRGTPNFHIDGAVNARDGGGGDFTLRACDGAITTDDGGVVIRDLEGGVAGQCAYRQFTGPVSTNWYGVDNAVFNGDTAATTNPSGHKCLDDMETCDATAAVAKAFIASAAYGDHGVTTDGRSIAITFADLDVPAGGYFTCEGPPGGAHIYNSGDYYWLLNNSVVLHAAYKISAHAQSRVTSCFIRPALLVPGWIPATNPTTADVVAARRSFTGQGFKCSGEACFAENLTIIGMDVGAEFDNSARATDSSLYFFDTNVPVYVTNQRGGMKLANVVTKIGLFNQIQGCQNPSTGCTRQGNVAVLTYPVTSVTNDGTGQIKLTLASGGTFPENVIQAGWSILGNGFGERLRANIKPSATITSSSTTISNIGAESGGGVDQNVGFIQSGYSVFDDTHPTCIADGTHVVSIDVDAAGVGTVITDLPIDADPVCTANFEALRFIGTSTAPPGCNGLWIVDSVSGQNIVCKGSSFSGPSYTATWVAGAKGMVVYDTTNIKIRQYICASGTAPFCTPPTGWTFSTTTATDAIVSTTSTGVLNVGSTVHWPAGNLGSVALAKIDDGTGSNAEIFSYSVRDSSSINILTRGENGTTGKTHLAGATVTAAAPTVIGVIAAAPQSDLTVDEISNVAVISDAPYTSTNGTVHFANDTTVVGLYVGEVRILPAYQSYTALTAGGGVPSANLKTTCSAGCTTATITITNGFKVFPGMSVRAVTHAGRLNTNTKVLSVTGNVVVLDHTPSQDITGDILSFTGCGYPAGQPWLGNCTGTSFLIKDSQGVTYDWLHSTGDRIAIHLINASATSGVDAVGASGGSSGSVRDDSSVALYIEGQSDPIQLTGGMLKGKSICIYNGSSRNNDGIGIINMQCGGSTSAVMVANMGTGATLHVDASHGNESNLIYADHKQSRLGLNGNLQQNTEVVFDDPVAATTINCTGNVFAGTICLSPSAAEAAENTATVDTVALLRSGIFRSAQTIFVKSWKVLGDNGGGWYMKLPQGTPGTVDNGNTFLCDAVNDCFQLINFGPAPNGQVYLSLDIPNSRLQLCPYNGPGWLMIDSRPVQIPATCIFLPDTASVGASNRGYIYALYASLISVTAIADNGSGKMRLTLNPTIGFQSGDALSCTTTASNFTLDAATVLVDSTHIDVTDKTFVNTGTGTCSWVGLTAQTQGHVTTNGIEVASNFSGARTLVGLVYMDGSQHFNDSVTKRNVASWYNRQQKTMVATLGANVATTVQTAYRTPATTLVEGEFVIWGPPTVPGTYPITTRLWRINAGAANSNLGAVNSVAIQMQGAAGSLDTACSTVEVEHSTQTQAVANYFQGYHPSGGASTSLTEGWNHADICIQVSAGTLTLEQNETSVEVTLWQ